jgi:Flp pilus assembly protein TadG
MFSKRESQSGQAFVIIVFMILGLFGFAALAIDGGMLYTERRRTQNAADAGALAAALAKVQAQNLHIAAFQRIESNGYPTTWGPCDPPGYDCSLGIGEDWAVQVSNPPRSGVYVGNDKYIQVRITSQVETSFAHLIFDGGLLTTVTAVSRVWPPQDITPGYALYGANKFDCKGLWFAGTGDTTITGGSIFSNSEDSMNCESGVHDGSASITVEPPPENIQVVGTFDMSGGGSVSPLPVVEGAAQQDLRSVPQPDCSGLTDYGKKKVNAGASETLNPGLYEEITFVAGATVTLNPGMYCIYGKSGFSGNGGTITGTGVMIYMQNGNFNLGGNSMVALAAEDDTGVLVDPSKNDWKGMLVYVDPSNTKYDVILTGTTDTAYTGTIYAPQNLCTITGTGDNIGLLSTQIICDKIKITGTAQVNIEYSQDEVYYLPPAIDLVR